jgi:hypothetical protein
MATVTKWSNVAVAMQSAAGGDLTISGITLANPGVVTSTAHGLVNGDYVTITTTSGMSQISGKVVRVANKTNDTFECEGVNTTSYTAFVAGTCSKITFGTSITTATSVSNSGGGFDFIDVTTIHNDRKVEVPGLGQAQTYSFDNLWDPADAGQIAMKTASDAQAQKAFKFTFGTGGKIMVFVGYVGFAGTPGGSAQDKVITQSTITAFGTPTYYAS